MSCISIFPARTNINDLFFLPNVPKNGDCVLTPAVCTCTKEPTGVFELYAEVINPPEDIIKKIVGKSYIVAPVLGKWDNSGQVKKRDQIFIIDIVDKDCDSSGCAFVSITANHIFSLLNSNQIDFEGFNSLVGDSKNDIRTYVTAAVTPGFAFSFGSSDITERRNIKLDSDKTRAGFVLDEGGILSVFKGEIHRDNLYFSINRRKEYSSGSVADPAFRLILGKEITNVKETIDYTETVTRLRTTKVNGYAVDFYTDNKKIGMPYPVTRYYRSSKQTDSERIDEAKRYFESVNHPQVSYTIQLSDINKSDEYSGISGLINCDIGDVGVVYSKISGINTVQKVTRTVEDVLEGCYTEISLGNLKSSIVRAVDQTRIIGSGNSAVIPEDSAGFTAIAAVSEGADTVYAGGYEVPSSVDGSYDAFIEYGDRNAVVLSETENHAHKHTYAYGGQYGLKYSAMVSGDIEPGIRGVVLWDYQNTASINNIIINKHTKCIGKFGEYVFLNLMSLTNVTIPKTVEYISPGAFGGCKNLTDIYYDGTIEEWIILNYGGTWINVYDMTVHCSDGETVQPGQLGQRGET